MLYRKNITDITYEDVVSFCNQGIKENEILEYKADFPGNLEKVISSMANTYGGIIIIGVDENDGLPSPPFKGIDSMPRLQERVTQIDISNIFPPVLPEIQVCPQQDNKTFVVIRIAESNSTPHYIKKKTQAYVRTGSVTTPERIADVNELEWLRHRREKSIELREELICNAEDNFRNICKIKGIQQVPYSRMKMAICPLLPNKSLISADKIEGIYIALNSKPRILYFSFSEYDIIPIPNGISIFVVKEKIEILDYLEINKFGLIHKIRNIPWWIGAQQTTTDKKTEGRRIDFKEIFVSLLSLFEFANLYYEKIGYKGLCKLTFEINNILNLSVDHKFEGAGIFGNGFALNDEIKLSEDCEVISIPQFSDVDFRLSLLLNISKDIAWSLGSQIEPVRSSDEIMIAYAKRRMGPIR